MLDGRRVTTTILFGPILPIIPDCLVNAVTLAFVQVASVSQVSDHGCRLLARESLKPLVRIIEPNHFSMAQWVDLFPAGSVIQTVRKLEHRINSLQSSLNVRDQIRGQIKAKRCM